MNRIIDSNTYTSHALNSPEGKALLKLYIRSFQAGGAKKPQKSKKTKSKPQKSTHYLHFSPDLTHAESDSSDSDSDDGGNGVHNIKLDNPFTQDNFEKALSELGTRHNYRYVEEINDRLGYYRGVTFNVEFKELDDVELTKYQEIEDIFYKLFAEYSLED
jgi:hypothetical protein